MQKIIKFKRKFERKSKHELKIICKDSLGQSNDYTDYCFICKLCNTRFLIFTRKFISKYNLSIRQLRNYNFKSYKNIQLSCDEIIIKNIIE